MEKLQITIEHQLHSRSRAIIWQAISTGGGLSKWVADEVIEHDNKYEFIWGTPWTHQEKRYAIIDKVKNDLVIIHWEDEPDNDSHVELRILRNDLTGDFTLQITDFVQDEDEDSIIQIWEQNLERLHRSTGL